jgi:hypothetical protein
MSATLRRLLPLLALTIALLFSQHAALLHGMAHAEHDIALATGHDGDAPALDHGLDTCAAFGALAQALAGAAAPARGEFEGMRARAVALAAAPAATRVGFDSRAPPLSA